MANKYANLVGTNKIKDEYSKINIGFDKVEADINAVDNRVDTIITTPIDGEAAAQELVDARAGFSTIGDRMTNIEAAAQELVDARAGFSTIGDRMTNIEEDIETHKAENASNTKRGHIYADKYVKLWEGNVSAPGEITLLSSCHGIYDGFIVQSGVGHEVMQYVMEFPSGSKISLADPSNGLTYYTYSGAGGFKGVDATGLKLNLIATGGQPLRVIYGIIKGTVVR
jgi:hypothetical protein